MNDRSGSLWRAALLLVLGCGTGSGTSPSPSGEPASPGGGAAVAPSPTPSVAPATCAAASKLMAWQSEIDGFDGGFRPTGSPAHEGYVAKLASELTALGVQDVHTEPYTFSKWTPAAWSLAVTTGSAAGPVALSGYVPYSGSTGPTGTLAPVVYVAPSSLPLSPSAVDATLRDPLASTDALAKQLRSSLAAATGSLVGKIVLFDVPRVALSLRQLTGESLYVNDPANAVSLDAAITRTDLSAMLAVNALLSALAASGAVGAIGILDLPEEAARGMYAPFFGTTAPNIPAVYVDRKTGASLRHALDASIGLLGAKLVLDATIAKATSENLVGVLPGASDREILLSSHTDGPNSMEDNGPVAILALASCLGPLPPAERPRTIRIVLSGGHFIGSKGLQSYSAAHAAELAAKAIVVMELEHLGAREWTETSPGTMGLTGRPELAIVSTPNTKSFVDASVAFARNFPRSLVATPPLLGEGHNFTGVPVIQFLTVPEYLLLGGQPTITSQLTDYALMERQVAAFIEMEIALSQAP